MRILALVFSLIVLLLLLLWWTTLSDKPAAVTTAANSSAATPLLQPLLLESQLLQNNDELSLQGNQIALSTQQLNHLLAQTLSSQLPGLALATDIALSPGQLTLFASLDTGLPLRRFLNLQATVEHGRLPLTARDIELGQLPIQEQELRQLLQWLIQQWPAAQQQQLNNLLNAVEQIQFQQDRMIVSYRLTADLIQLFQPDQLYWHLDSNLLARVTFYQQALTTQPPSDLLAQQLASLCRMAPYPAKYPVIELQAIVMTLAQHAAPARIQQWLQQTELPTPAQTNSLRLHKRKDLAQHFLTSAVITYYSNKRVADAAGLYKEFSDHQQNRFDVADLIANRSGSLFADISRRQPQDAADLLQRCASIESESDMFPAINNVQGKLSELGDALNDQRAVQQAEQQIDQAIFSTPLFRQWQPQP